MANDQLPDEPLVLRSGQWELRLTGTAFNVNAGFVVKEAVGVTTRLQDNNWELLTDRLATLMRFGARIAEVRAFTISHLFSQRRVAID